MGHQPKLGFLISLYLITLGACLSASAPDLPEYLPEPPPLPEVLLQGPPALPPDLPDPSVLFAQLRQLEELISLTPEQLKGLRQTIEFIERMSPSEREAMRLRLVQIKRLPPEMRGELNSLKAFIHPLEHANLTQFWLAASQEEKKAFLETLSSLPETQKSDFLQAEIAAFLERRDAVFSEIRTSLEKKKGVNQSSGEDSP